MSEQQVQIEDVLRALREMIGQQAQELAVLKATIAAIQKDKVE